MYITWLGQSGYLLQCENTTICLDAYLSDAVYYASGKKRLVEVPVSAEEISADAVICTHDHLDHLDPETVRILAKTGAVFLAPEDCREKMVSLGVKKYTAFEEESVWTVGPFKIEAVFAHHTVPAMGVMITCRGKKLYFSGDTFYHPRLALLKEHRPDYMFICINGKLGNMNVEEAVRLTGEIKPGIAVPNHYGMFAENTEDPELFTREIRNSMVFEVGKRVLLP